MGPLPENLFKRKHFGTPESLLLILVNYVIMAVNIELFAMCNKISTGFWVVIALLALYNYFNIKRNSDEYDRAHIIAYFISLAGIVMLFVLFRMKAGNC